MANLGISEVRESSFPPVGTFVDSGRLKLVSIIGTGGYGVVYHAIDAHGFDCRSYAVKCLIQADERSQSHHREIALHGLACSHPGIVTLHRVVEEDIYRYFIMEYAPDQDLFVQILHKCRYLGNDALVKDAFLQLLDAIEHCHSLGIYHRDLKPENVVCFEDGCRLALTDFGLATTQDTSGEFKTGSVYHMSPECQRSDVTDEGLYSPQSCDIWSLGVVFLNIVTGRNPWKSATCNDATFRSYCHSPFHFLLKILPISLEFNDILVTMLNLEWRARPSIQEIRLAITQLDTFYSRDAVFEGNVARCPWETGIDLGTGTHKGNAKVNVPPKLPKRPFKTHPKNLTQSSNDDCLDDSNEIEVPQSATIEDSCGIRYTSSYPPLRPTPQSGSFSSSDPSSPNTPDNADLSIDRHLAYGSMSPFNSLVSGIQRLFRLCSSIDPLHPYKERSSPDPQMFTIDL